MKMLVNIFLCLLLTSIIGKMEKIYIKALHGKKVIYLFDYLDNSSHN